MGHTKRVQNVILVSKNAQFGSKWGLSIRTSSRVMTQARSRPTIDRERTTSDGTLESDDAGEK